MEKCFEHLSLICTREGLNNQWLQAKNPYLDGQQDGKNNREIG